MRNGESMKMRREIEYYSACKFIERTLEDSHQALIFYSCVIIFETLDNKYKIMLFKIEN